MRAAGSQHWVTGSFQQCEGLGLVGSRLYFFRIMGLGIIDDFGEQKDFDLKGMAIIRTHVK